MARSRGDLLFATSRFATALSGIVVVIAGWYVAMTVAIGGTDGGRARGATTALAVLWLLAGAGSLVAAGLGRRYATVAAVVELLAGVTVVTTAALSAPLGVAPGTVMIAAGYAAMLSRVGPGREATATGPAARHQPRDRELTTTGAGRAA